MSNRKMRFLLPAGLLLVTLSIASAGPLDPPPGAVAPTYKTLAETEPRIAINATNTPPGVNSLFRITAPGSYYLTGNVTGVANKVGIEISASHVTIDLMGFQLAGAGQVGVGATGIVSSGGGGLDITVRNGSIHDWKGPAIDFATATSIQCTVVDVTAQSNNSGILAHDFAKITRCSVQQSLNGDGIRVGAHSAIIDCTSTTSGGSGDGIETGESCIIQRCITDNNLGIGIRAGTASNIRDCSAKGNSGDGISANNDCVVQSCTVSHNVGRGINGNNHALIRDCACIGNTGEGITVIASSTVLSNLCQGNGTGGVVAAGIHVTAGTNRIEENNCVGNGRGIEVDGTHNFITRNTCSGNTTSNFDIAAGNVGLFVLSSAPAAQLAGNSGGVAPGSSDPNANFSY